MGAASAVRERERERERERIGRVSEWVLPVLRLHLGVEQSAQPSGSG